VWLPALVLLVALCGGLALQLQRTQTAGKTDLRDRFQLRTTLTAGFTRSFVVELQSREHAQAMRWLSGRTISATTFNEIAGSFGFNSAVILDRQGHVLAVYPSDPKLIGTHLAPKYAHLRAAVAGHAAVSSVVLSAARHQPIVASAMPYTTRYGRRVLSGGFDISTSPVGAYLRSSTSIPHSVFAIDDGTGTFVTGSAGGVSRTIARLIRRTGSRQGYVVATHAVAGTPWTVDAVVPANSLYQPLQHRNILYWSILLAFGATCLAAMLLLYRLMRSRETLRRLAAVDPLTGAWNRRALEDAYLRRAVERARDGRRGSLLLLDLDGFKEVNDLLGHARGDELLRNVVATLRATLRASDWVARIGGDEFAVLLPDADLATALLVASKIERVFARPAASDVRHALPVHVSIGHASEGAEPCTLAELLAQADIEMYRAKSRTRSTVLEPIALSV
jgi:diguanylate cyclase (GGDEF)-like protein